MKAIKLLICVVLLILGYFYTYIYCEQGHGFKQLKTQFTHDNLFTHCEWNELSSLLDCFQAPYLSFIKDSCPFMAQRAFKLQVDIYHRDYNYHVSEFGKVNSTIKNLELSNLFISVANRASINRKRNQFPGIVLAYYHRKETMQLYQKQFIDYQKQYEKFKSTINSDPSLLLRSNNAISTYQKIIATGHKL